MKSAGYILILFAALSLASAEIRNKGWWKHMVFYQIYPKSFMDSDGDGTGDLKGITSKLEHFVDIGVGGIWLSPINKSPQVDNGYDISDFEAIDEKFGTMADFENLISKAHQLGLKVIMDLVPNHTSDKHKWFELSRNKTKGYEDYYVWHGGKNGTVPNNWVSVFNKTGWTMDETRKQYYYHQFYPEQPDLNYNNTAVQEEMKKIITFWLDKGLDGFRIDAVPHLVEGDITLDEPAIIVENANKTDHVSFIHTLTKDQLGTYNLVKSWRDHVDKYAETKNKNEVLLMTEAYTNLENTLKYYNYGSDVPFNFKYITDASVKSNVSVFKSIAESWIGSMPSRGTPNWVMGNHDRVRLLSRYPDRGDQMIMLEMILPGVAVTYYGEEIGMVDFANATTADQKSDFRDGCRTPMQWNNKKFAGFTTGSKTWLNVHTNYDKLNVEAQKNDPKSVLNLYKQLTNLRKSPVLRNGLVDISVLKDKVLVVKRSLGEDLIALLINFDDKEEITVNVKDVMEGKTSLVESTDTLTSMTLNSAVNLDNFKIPKKASVILKSSASTFAASVASILLIAIVTLFRS